MAVSRLTQTSLQNAFQKYNSIWDGKTAVGSMEAISSITLSAAQSSVEFNNIPGTYSHLQLRVFLRDSRNYGRNDIYMRVGNGSIDTGSNYSWHRLYGTGSAAGANAGTTQTFMNIATLSGNTAPASTFGTAIIDVLDYTSTNKQKTIRTLGGADNNGTAELPYISLTSGSWIPSSIVAITAIQLYDETGSNFMANSTFSLYGIK